MAAERKRADAAMSAEVERQRKEAEASAAAAAAAAAARERAAQQKQEEEEEAEERRKAAKKKKEEEEEAEEKRKRKEKEDEDAQLAARSAAAAAAAGKQKDEEEEKEDGEQDDEEEEEKEGGSGEQKQEGFCGEVTYDWQVLPAGMSVTELAGWNGVDGDIEVGYDEAAKAEGGASGSGSAGREEGAEHGDKVTRVRIRAPWKLKLLLEGGTEEGLAGVATVSVTRKMTVAEVSRSLLTLLIDWIGLVWFGLLLLL